MRRETAFAIVTAAALSIAPSAALARPEFPALIPSGSVYGCSNCHVSAAGGGARTPFGEDFRSLGFTWNATLAARDSDGDGYDNARELLDPARGYIGAGGYLVRNPGVPSDMNECALGWDACSALASCTNTATGGLGSYTCACNSGYMGDGRTCTDVNECPSVTSCAPGACSNTPGDYTCSCPTGYGLSTDRHSCTSSCMPGYGIVGGVCTYQGCAVSPCGPGALGCLDVTPSSGAPTYECWCRPGASAVSGAATPTCTDARPIHIGLPSTEACYPAFLNMLRDGVTIINGSSARTDASNYYEYVEAREISPAMCGFGGTDLVILDRACGSGGVAAGGGSYSVCADGMLPVRDFWGCTATGVGRVGRYQCGTAAQCDAGTVDCCGPSYHWNAATDRCDDDDECAGTINPCGAGTCTNTVGSYDCTCPTGTIEDTYFAQHFNTIRTCFDVNECAAGGLCAGGSCVNDYGAYHCTCGAGYLLAASGRACMDIDECSSAPCGVGTCVNTPGAYSCTCPMGYASSAGTCIDVDECATGALMCPAGTPCTNTVGGALCGCVPGRAVVGGVCADVDECADGTDFCDDVSERCSNTDGAYTCACAMGFTRDAVGVCTDVDECALATDECGIDATCVNGAGTYVCTCAPEFMLRGFDCVPVEPCLDGSLVCGTHELCVDPVDGPAACACEVGYARASLGAACVGVCGDGTRVEGELCDDANTAAGDGCALCEVERGWRCIDGAGASTCEQTCGDGLVDADEECDDAAGNSDTALDACRTSCERAHCGDSIVDTGERCDRGDTALSCTECDPTDGGGADAGRGDGGTAADGGAARVESGGCDCHAAAGRRASFGWLALLALGALGWRRRARRR